jgi:hypothetical protein
MLPILTGTLPRLLFTSRPRKNPGFENYATDNGFLLAFGGGCDIFCLLIYGFFATGECL